MSLRHNGHQAAGTLGARGPALIDDLVAELTRQAQLVARAMQRNSPTFQSVLRGSVAVEVISPTERFIGPHVDYAQAVNDGVEPGKGLPRFGTPEARDATEWLRRTPATGPRALAARILSGQDLRDRYMGLSAHIRKVGTRGTQFVEKTHAQMAASVAANMKAAAARSVAKPSPGAAA